MDLFTRTSWIRQRPLASYLIATLLSLAALLSRLAIGPVLTGFPFLTFFPVVLLAAYLGGQGPGVLCVVLSTVLAWYFLVEPSFSFELAWPGGYIAIGFFVLVAGSIVLLVSAMNRAYQHLSSAERELSRLNLDLEARVAARTSDLVAANEALKTQILAREDAEARAAQLQRMEAVGQLTGGVAHDFNNMLGIIVGNLDLAQRRLERGSSDIMRYIDGAMDGAQRGATLTRRLLAFARKQPLQPVVDANGLVAGMAELLRRTLGERIEVECVLAGGLWRIRADPGQLEGAIVNIAVNARDAMPNGGKLTVETMNAHLDEGYAEENPGVAAGQYVLIAVTDTGTGMPREVAERAFEPFFTTKEVGRGTGLGLSQIYGYLKQSGGHAKIYSEEGRGTTIRLYIPRYTGDSPQTSLGRAPAAEPARPAGRADETILVVEDEAAVRATTVETLRELGYSVRHAPDGATALSILTDHPGITLMFTDVVMPGMTGRELADEARRRHPGLKVLYTTGYTRNSIVHGGQLDEGVDLLAKPFTGDQLARKLREVLG
jgi:signal transduction histidine kinase